MRIVHLALGGCLTSPKVRYGITADTGGHIAYILGAATAQARRSEVVKVDIVTRAFDDPLLGRDHMLLNQPVGPKLSILRLATRNSRYLAKEGLAAERPALRRSFRELIASMPEPPDVIHAHFADAVAVASTAASTFGIPLIYTPHSLGIDKAADDLVQIGSPLGRRISEERAALSRSNAIIVSSRDEAEKQVAQYDVDVSARTHHVSPGHTLTDMGSDTSGARALVDPYLTQPDLPMMLAIARPVRKKNLVGLVQAYLWNTKLRDHANLVILAGQRGTGVAQTAEMSEVIEELEALAATAPGKIALPERHDPSIPAQLYRLAKDRRGVFVNPAIHEPFGLTLLEAAQVGLPVVATQNGGPADIVSTLKHGELVDPHDLPGIGRAMERLLFDTARWRAASRAGSRADRLYDWDRWADRTGNVYRQVCRGRGQFEERAHEHLSVCNVAGSVQVIAGISPAIGQLRSGSVRF